MLPALLSLNSKSWLYALSLSIPYLQQWMTCHRWGWYQLWKPQLYELSLPSHAQTGHWGKASLQKPFLSFQLYPLLNTALPHALSNYWSHSCLVFLSFRSNSFQTKQSRSVWEEVSIDLLKPTQKWSSLDLKVSSDHFLRKRTLKTAWRLVLRNYSKQENTK